jgi:hypothetical protein
MPDFGGPRGIDKGIEIVSVRRQIDAIEMAVGIYEHGNCEKLKPARHSRRQWDLHRMRGTVGFQCAG